MSTYFFARAIIGVDVKNIKKDISDINDFSATVNGKSYKFELINGANTPDLCYGVLLSSEIDTDELFDVYVDSDTFMGIAENIIQETGCNLSDVKTFVNLYQY